ncbi:TetR/AcrR family transcriptional regulator, partial [Streptomyces sp. NPDC057052]
VRHRARYALGAPRHTAAAVPRRRVRRGRRPAARLATDDRDGPARLSTLVGAVVLARAVEDSRPSDGILAAARAALPPARAR